MNIFLNKSSSYLYKFSAKLLPRALGLVGALINDRVASGILLILSSFMSLSVFFEAFGIGFVLMLIGGILTLIKT